MADPMTAPSLVGKKVYLRPATPEDIMNSQHLGAPERAAVILAGPQSYRGRKKRPPSCTKATPRSPCS